jgi:SAM-dependent methyltransferase
MELLIGAGNNREKRIRWTGVPDTFLQLVTLDVDESLPVDVHHDLNHVPYPFDDDMFDEIHAYEVLEHCGRQGDWRFFFNQFYEFWRILKPGGFFVATVPMWDSPWAWGDPGHARVIPKEALYYLMQKLYEQEVGKTPLQDYRGVWKGDFELFNYKEDEHRFAFILKAIKESNGT